MTNLATLLTVSSVCLSAFFESPLVPNTTAPELLNNRVLYLTDGGTTLVCRTCFVRDRECLPKFANL